MDDAAELIRAISTLAWPVFVLVAVIVFRQQLVNLLSPSTMRRFKAGPLEVEWDRRLAEVEVEIEEAGVLAPTAATDLATELAEVARASPTAAVMEAYARVEAELQSRLRAAGLPQEMSYGSAVRLARLAAQHGLISEDTVRAVEGIAVLRNLAAHVRISELTPEQAIDYLVLVDSVLYAIRHPPEEVGRAATRVAAGTTDYAR